MSKNRSHAHRLNTRHSTAGVRKIHTARNCLCEAWKQGKLKTLFLKDKYLLWQHHRDRQRTGDVKLGIPVLSGQRGVEGSEPSAHPREGAFTAAGHVHSSYRRNPRPIPADS